ncbi:transmembrane channel-like protein 5 isoform X2 [Narcine bancroftii]|uniref:transmembrane channel-like protein 5 isoform X2 n=1 Tax=Narcine bancroftii TaxID=1343680 RepID=UPI0038313D47
MHHQEPSGYFTNYAYHDSETLELDRGAQGRFSKLHTTPLPSSSQRDLFDLSDVWSDWEHPEVIPMTTVGREHIDSGSPFTDINPYGNNAGYVPEFESIADESYSTASSTYNGQSHQDHSFIPNFHRNVDISNQEPAVVQRRKSTGDPKRLAFLAGVNYSQFRTPEQEISEEKREEKRELVAELVALSPSERAKAIQELTLSMDEKRKIRERVHLEIGPKSMEAGYKINSCTQLLNKISSPLRRFHENMTEIFHSVHPWHRSLKVIGGKFGTGVLSYFTFLKWLLMFNIFSFLINFSFITIPQFFALSPNNLTFTGLELLTGAGYFTQTIFYYGFYTNGSIQASPTAEMYNMQLAYFLTFGFYMLICFLCLVYRVIELIFLMIEQHSCLLRDCCLHPALQSMAKTFNENFITIETFSGEAAKLLCSWDFKITNEKTVQLKKRSLSTQLKERLSDKMNYKRQLTRNQKIVRFLIHLITWIISLGTTFGCCFGVHSYCVSNFQVIQKDPTQEELQKQAATLFLPFLVSSINLFIPLFFSFLGFMERFKYPWHEIYVLIIRNVLLNMSITGVLCYYWLVTIANTVECWETFVGQDLYRLVVADFIFSLFSSFFGEFIRSIMGTHFCPKLGIPEFDIARNVLGLIYAQTLGWIGLFFSPLLPAIQIIKFFITFHVKKVSLMMNCQPPRMAWRASHMTTIFIFLLFFPAFIGVLCLIGVTVWSLKPSEYCGPFRGLRVPYSSISRFIHGRINQMEWLTWIYDHLLLNPLFFFILTIIVFAFIYLYWQIIDGRKMMAKLLQEHIINEGKDKTYLLQKLTAIKAGEACEEKALIVTFNQESDQRIQTRTTENHNTPLPGYAEELLKITIPHFQAMQKNYSQPNQHLERGRGTDHHEQRLTEDSLTINNEALTMTSELEEEGHDDNPSTREEAGIALALALAAKHQAEQ